MFGRTKTDPVKDHAAGGEDFALALSRDKKFRKELLSAIGHGAKPKRQAVEAGRLVRRRDGRMADKHLRRELDTMTKNLQGAWGRVEKQSAATSCATPCSSSAAARPQPPARTSFAAIGRERHADQHDRRVDRGRRSGLDRLQPVDAVRGVPALHGGRGDVQQLDDTRLHWVATIGGRRSSGTRRSSSSTRTSRSAGSARTARRPAAPSASSDSATEDADPPLDELPGRGPARALRLGRRPRQPAQCRATSTGSRT